ncbi:MAG TPA: phage portal protein, partial [Chloroflexota bacterium]|nr:phage portal protein [Chloroflexota bacterium]
MVKRFLGRILLNAARYAAVHSKSELVRAGYHKIRNWYEGGWPILSGDTSYVPSIVQDSRFDQSYITRREMLRRMRYWSQNSAIVESILSVGERYTVGPSGLHVSWYPTDDASQDSDDTWYDRAEQVTAEAFEDFGWNGESMETLLKIGYRCQKIDGDVMFIKTRRRKSLDLGKQRLMVSQPCLQIIEGHRIETPFNKWTNEGITTMDGIEFELVQVDGRPLLQRVGFWVRTGFGEFEQNTSWDLIPNAALFYLRNEQRASQPRAVSDFYAVEPDIHKLEDLLLMELKAQNSQSNRAVKIENAAGELNPLDPKLRAIQTARGIT